MSAKRATLSITADGDSYSASGDAGLIHCEFEGFYAIFYEGTLGGSTTITPYIAFGDSRKWHQLDVPNSSDQTQFVIPTHGNGVIVPGNSVLKFVTANYSGSSSLKVRRIRVAS